MLKRKPSNFPNLPRLMGGAVGYISYDVVRYFERLPQTAQTVVEVPEAAYMLADTMVIFDHAKHQLILLSHARNEGDPTLPLMRRWHALMPCIIACANHSCFLLKRLNRFVMSLSLIYRVRSMSKRCVARKNRIAAGDAFQIVLSRRFTCRTSASPIAVYRALRATKPIPYMFMLNFGEDFTLMGASPEMMRTP
jgi:anthranilate synthase component 1